MNKNKKLLLFSLLFVVILVAIFFSYNYFSNNKTYQSSRIKETTAKSRPIKQNNQSASNSVGNPNPDSNTTAKSGTTNTTTSGSNLEEPYGQFVSNNSPSMGSYEESICETTPGASCQINFIGSNGNTVSLPTKTTDSQGVAAWSWYVEAQKGFNSGTWKIEAISSLNGQTKVATGTLNIQ